MGEANHRFRIFPVHPIASAFVTVTAVALIGIAAVMFSTTCLGTYGYLLFVGLPFMLGFLTTVIHGAGGPRGIGQMLGITAIAMAVVCAAMIAFGLEGLGCLIMVLPLWCTTALVGTLCAYPIHVAAWRHLAPRGFSLMVLGILCALPALMGAEKLADLQPPLIAVESSVDIDAPPEQVWNCVIEFPEIPRPHDWVFTLGAAYPKHAVILGHGVGAVRHCVFSTGAFVEPITVWDENHRLAFDVAQSPPSMQEWSIYENIHPPHVEGYLLSRHGEFLLTPLPNGRTRLQGTTWYQNYMFPASYWQLWSDAVIHRIHLRVLEHIKTQAEGRNPPGKSNEAGRP